MKSLEVRKIMRLKYCVVKNCNGSGGDCNSGDILYSNDEYKYQKSMYTKLNEDSKRKKRNKIVVKPKQIPSTFAKNK